MQTDLVTKDSIKNARLEKIFYLTLAVTVMHGGLIKTLDPR